MDNLIRLEKEFYSHGKLLLTGEYVVLDGALALAIPTRYGQKLQFKVIDSNELQWNSYDEKGNIWFSEIFDLQNLLPKNANNPISITLSNILSEARKLNPEFLQQNQGIEAYTLLDFPRHWGLGTSSTLINNIAQWAKVDAFALLDKSFGGSGYDIAAAQNAYPIFYQKTKDGITIRKTHLNWDFTDSLFFVHLNKKQDSKEGIAHYRKHGVDEKILHHISEISNQLPLCTSLNDFEALIEEHENIISDAIQMPSVKEQYFSDYSGCIKSLGAWGGDFILATGGESEQAYFRDKNFKTIISFKEMTEFNS